MVLSNIFQSTVLPTSSAGALKRKAENRHATVGSGGVISVGPAAGTPKIFRDDASSSLVRHITLPLAHSIGPGVSVNALYYWLWPPRRPSDSGSQQLLKHTDILQPQLEPVVDIFPRSGDGNQSSIMGLSCQERRNMSMPG